MDWVKLLPLLSIVGATFTTAIIGYLFGISKDRSAAIRTKQIEAITQLHERVLEIERKELSDGKSITLTVSVHGGTNKPSGPMSDEEVNYLSKLYQWRQELIEEEDRARLWIDRRTVSLVSNYFLLMMDCKHWEKFGQGLLIEDKCFLHYLRCIFGRTENILRKIIIENSKTGEPLRVNCVLLSDMCLKVIQQRVRLEVSSPFRFRLKSLWWRWLERRESKESPERGSCP